MSCAPSASGGRWAIACSTLCRERRAALREAMRARQSRLRGGGYGAREGGGQGGSAGGGLDGGDSAGDSAGFMHGSDAYIFIAGSGTSGLRADDLLLKLTGVDLTAAASDTLDVATDANFIALV